MPRLILASAEGQQVVDLRPHNSLGRHPNNSIQLLDKIVSKEHCTIELREGTFVLRDLGSLNGTFINNERVHGERPLRHGDEITLGSTRARYDEGAGPIVGPGGGTVAVPPSSGTPPWTPQPPRPPYPNYGQQQPFGPPPASVGSPASHAPGSQVPAPAFTPGVPPSSGVPATQQAYGPPIQPVQPVPQPPMPHPAMGAMANNPGATRIQFQEANHTIGTQIAAVQKGFQAFDALVANPAQLKDDYERLRLSYELSREIALERDRTKLLEKILAMMFKVTRADRGVILLKNDRGQLEGMVSRRRDGSDTPITVSSTIINRVIQDRSAVLTNDAAQDFSAAKGKSVILSRITSAIVVPLMHNDEVLGILWLDSEMLAQFQPKDLELAVAVANQSAMFIQVNLLGKKVEEQIVMRERLSKMLSPNVAELVASGKVDVKPGGTLVRECTVFNSDIRGFTRMSEGESPEVIVTMLNEYFELMVESIFKHEGTLDKFMGDGIMALWGAPIEKGDDAIRSVQCALEQMEALGEFNRQREGKNHSPVAVGIGIHTGELVAGYVGSSKTLSYTVIGDTANTSARLCGVAAAGQIVVSEATYARLNGRFEVEELKPQSLKGKEKPMRVFNVLREHPMGQVPADIGKN